jgi:hypothetical protein
MIARTNLRADKLMDNERKSFRGKWQRRFLHYRAHSRNPRLSSKLIR